MRYHVNLYSSLLIFFQNAVLHVSVEVRLDVLIKSGELRLRVNHRLGRDNVTSTNIRAALEQIPCSVIRGPVLREIVSGSFHPKEEVVLSTLFPFFE